MRVIKLIIEIICGISLFSVIIFLMIKHNIKQLFIKDRSKRYIYKSVTEFVKTELMVE